MPIQLLRAGKVLHAVQEHVLVALEEAQRRVVEVRRQPIGADEAFRVHVAFGGDTRIRGVGQCGN